MNEVLLQAMIEKLDQLAVSNQQVIAKINAIPEYRNEFKDMNGRLDMTLMEIKSIPGWISMPVEEIREQRISVNALTDQLKRPLQQMVKNVHYLDKPVICCIVLVGIVLLLIVWIGQLYGYIHVREKSPFYPMVTMPIDSTLIEVKVKPHKLKERGIIPKMSSKKKYHR